MVNSLLNLRNKRRKNGMFLSIELITVIIIVVVIIASTASATKYMYETYRQKIMLKEIMGYQEAFKKFYTTYGYEAGLIKSTQMSGELNSPNLASVGITNGLESFRELALAGLISSDKVNLKVLFNATTSSATPSASGLTIYGNFSSATDKAYSYLDQVVGNILPRASWNYNVHFNATVDSIHYKTFTTVESGDKTLFRIGRDILGGSLNRVMSLSNEYSYNGLTSNSSTSPYLFSLGYGANTNWKCYDLANCTTTLTATTGTVFTPRIAAMSSIDAYKLDLKADDGHPGTGWIMAENVMPYTSADRVKGLGCHTAPLNYTSGTDGWIRIAEGGLDTAANTLTASTFQSVAYNNSSSFTPYNGCVMFFNISVENT